MEDKLILDRRGRRGQAILKAIMRCQNQRAMRLLDKYGCEFDVQAQEDGMGHTILHAAAWYGVDEIVSRLLDCGADVHARDHRLHTPLISAAWMGKTKSLRMLVEFQRRIENVDMCAGIRWATYDNGYNSIPLLLAAGASIDLPAAIALGDEAAARRLISNGADLEWKDPANGDSLMHVAYWTERKSSAQLLLEHGCQMISHGSDARIERFDDWMQADIFEREPFKPNDHLTADFKLLVAHMIEEGWRFADDIAADTGIELDTINQWWQTYRYSDNTLEVEAGNELDFNPKAWTYLAIPDEPQI